MLSTVHNIPLLLQCLMADLQSMVPWFYLLVLRQINARDKMYLYALRDETSGYSGKGDEP